MAKRVGYLYEKVIDIDNCREAVIKATDGLKKTKYVKWLRSHVDKVAKEVQRRLIVGWNPGPIRYRIIKEGPYNKERKIVIANKMDHIIHTAIMLPLIPLIERRLDFYCCGSVPDRGPRRVVTSFKKWVREGKYNYAAEIDVKHFYDNCSRDVVISALRRIVKDEKYLFLHECIFDQMEGYVSEIINETDELIFDVHGIGIGFSPSHWYGNLVLTDCDRELRKRYGNIVFARYMDNYVLLSNRKRTLHSAVNTIRAKLKEIGLEIKNDWQVYKIKSRPVRFLSYRFYANGMVLLTKSIMYRISRKAKKAKTRPNAHNARSLFSLLGIAYNANSHNFLKRYVHSVVNTHYLRRLISNADSKRALHNCSTPV